MGLGVFGPMSNHLQALAKKKGRAFKGDDGLDWGDGPISISASVDDIPITDRRCNLDTLSLKEIMAGTSQHRFTFEELEHLLKVLAFKCSVYLNNQFHTY